MTQIKVDNIADAAGTGAPDFEDGLTVAGSALSTLNTAEYYSSATEPASPKNGAIWWDTASEKVMVYIAGEFKEVELGASAGGLIEWTVDLSTASYDSVSFSVASQESSPYALTFSTDGTKMYMAGSGSSVHQYSLSTAFDLSTASYDSVSFSVTSQDGSPRGLTFNTDGTKMYVVGVSDSVHQYSLSTGFDLSTASYDSVSLDITSQDSAPTGVTFSNDGTKMYVAAVLTDSIYQYSLSTAFDLSTASYDNVSLDVSSQDGSMQSIAFNPDGTKMYGSGLVNDTLFQYSLSTGFDLSTASYDSVSFSVASQDGVPSEIFFSDDGAKIYIMGNVSATVYQYSTGL